MTFDPYRNQLPHDPVREYRDPDETGAGAGILLAALLLAALGGFVYLFANTDAQNVATNDMRPPVTQPSTTGAAPAPETTGSSANMPAMPRLEPKAEPILKPVE